MALIRIEHPLVDDVLTVLRDRSTTAEVFRRSTRKLTTLLVFASSRDLPARDVEVATPMEATGGRRLAAQVALVPVLRAGMGMLEPMLEIFPEASVGYVGLERDEETAIARRYYCKLPDLTGRHVFLLDPMLATGGSALAAIEAVREQAVRHVRLLSIIAAPEGIALLEQRCPEVDIYVGAVDRELDARKFILPGLGDFGDRLFGT